MTYRPTPALPILLLALTLGPSSRAAEAPDYTVPNKDWLKGPARIIATDDEEKEFKKLKTDEERAEFAKKFWEKRDPTPGTPENEYQVIFWKRVESADKKFKSNMSSKPGSQTDMGRAFLLLGPPTSVDKDAKDYSIWTFEPSDVNGITQHLTLRFAPSDTGAPLLLDRKTLEQYVAAHQETRGIGWKVPVLKQAAGENAQAPAAPSRQAAEDQSPESQRQIPILEAALSKGNGPTDVPFQATYDYYAAVDGTTLTSITVEAPRDAAHGAGDSGLLPYARIVPAAGEGKSANLTGAQPFVAAPLADAPAGSFVYQARRNLAPGSYRIAVVVEDKVMKGKMGTLVQTIDVPNFAAKEFALNTVTLLAGFERVDAALGPDEKERGAGPFVIGSFRLVPRAVPVLQKDEALSFYYQVYGPVPDPATGKYSLEATYSFSLKDGGIWKPFRKPIVKTLQGQVELYSIDLKDFLIPNQKLPADFKMEIKVADKGANREVTREVAFSVR